MDGDVVATLNIFLRHALRFLASEEFVQTTIIPEVIIKSLLLVQVILLLHGCARYLFF